MTHVDGAVRSVVQHDVLVQVQLSRTHVIAWAHDVIRVLFGGAVREVGTEGVEQIQVDGLGLNQQVHQHHG